MEALLKTMAVDDDGRRKATWRGAREQGTCGGRVDAGMWRFAQTMAEVVEEATGGGTVGRRSRRERRGAGAGGMHRIRRCYGWGKLPWETQRGGSRWEVAHVRWSSVEADALGGSRQTATGVEGCPSGVVAIVEAGRGAQRMKGSLADVVGGAGVVIVGMRRVVGGPRRARRCSGLTSWRLATY